jgi:amidohydrolase
MFEIKKAVEQEKEYLQDMYVYFHENPEVGGKEENTIKVVMDELKKMGIACEHRQGGVIGWINKGKAGKKIGLRADVDALPMAESPDNLKGPRRYCSNTDAAMHACGHDGHTAMLLTAAKIMVDHADDVDGEVVLMFEQGEEMGYGVDGIAQMVLDEKPDAIWGIHLYADMESGKISVDAGPRMAAGIFFEIEITGQGGHGSRPDLSQSPIDCLVDVYSNMNQMKMTALDPFKATTFSVGKIHGGSAPNIIPESISFAGSFRVTDLEESKKAVSRTKEILEHCCALHHCTYKIASGLKPSGMIVMNHPGLAKAAEDAIRTEMGEQYLKSVPPWMASESMSKYLKYAPGVFAFVGISNEEKGTGAAHHNPRFEVDEEVLPLGVMATLAYTRYVMAHDVDTSDFIPNPHTPEELTKEPWLG